MIQKIKMVNLEMDKNTKQKLHSTWEGSDTLSLHQTKGGLCRQAMVTRVI